MAKVSLNIAADAFSDGQIRSKLWLCGELEKLHAAGSFTALGEYLDISVLAGWNGMLPFLLFSRQRLPIQKIDLFDKDPLAVKTSLQINDTWRIAGKFRAHHMDLDLNSVADFGSNLWINTSCEHFSQASWWAHLPKGARVVLQGTDMVHEEHVHSFSSLDDFSHFYEPWDQVDFRGKLDFEYPGFCFSRYMVIGRKG